MVFMVTFNSHSSPHKISSGPWFRFDLAIQEACDLLGYENVSNVSIVRIEDEEDSELL